MAEPMGLMAFYPQIKWVHIAAVSASGSLFALRGALVQAGQPRWAMAAPVRYLSYTIDTVLLTAALMLLTILPGAMFANGWLTTKLVLVVVVCRARHVRAQARTHAARARRLLLAALLVFVTIIGIAIAHHPLGWLLRWFG